MIKQPLHRKIRSNQQGAILAVSLIMLFLLSILGLAVMRTSTLEEKMAANALHEDIAFQAAETVSEEAMSDPDNMTDAFDSGSSSVSIPFSNPNMPMVQATTILSYSGEGLPPEYSLGLGQGKFQAYRFVVDTTGTINEANTKTRIIQGAYRIAPAPQGQ